MRISDWSSDVCSSDLDDDRLAALSEQALDLGMDVLVEVHDMAELERALQVPAPLLGINNRNLRTFEASLDTTLALKEAVPGDRSLLTDSGHLAHGAVPRKRAVAGYAFVVGAESRRKP